VLIVNAPAGTGDKISITGQGSVTLTGLTSEPDKGVVILQDPNSSNTVSFAGQGVVTLTGVVYAPDALVSITGNANVTINPGAGTAAAPPPILGALIAFDLRVTGNGVLTINPDDPPAVSMTATTNAGANSAALIGGSPLLLAGGLPTGGQSVAFATVTPSGGTTPPTTPTVAATGYYSTTGGTADVAGLAPAQAKQTGGSVWDLSTIAAADLINGLLKGEIVITI
jgi:hypothetical protein